MIMLVSRNQNFLWKEHRLSIATKGGGGILCHKNVLVSYCFVFCLFEVFYKRQCKWYSSVFSFCQDLLSFTCTSCSALFMYTKFWICHLSLSQCYKVMPSSDFDTHFTNLLILHPLDKTSMIWLWDNVSFFFSLSK